MILAELPPANTPWWAWLLIAGLGVGATYYLLRAQRRSLDARSGADATEALSTLVAGGASTLIGELRADIDRLRSDLADSQVEERRLAARVDELAAALAQARTRIMRLESFLREHDFDPGIV